MSPDRLPDALVIARQLRAALAADAHHTGPLTVAGRERLEISASALESLAVDPVSIL